MRYICTMESYPENILQKKAAIIFLIGFMGSGKSHWGKIWADEYGYSFIDLDDAIEKYEKKTVGQVFTEKGESYFREIESLILRTFISKTNLIIACGGGTPCFNDNMEWMNQHGITVYMKATPQQLAERLEKERDKRPVLQQAGEGSFQAFIEKKLEERKNFYEAARITIPVGEISGSTLSEYILNYTEHA